MGRVVINILRTFTSRCIVVAFTWKFSRLPMVKTKAYTSFAEGGSLLVQKLLRNETILNVYSFVSSLLKEPG
jgi:hypothetical protein